MCKPLEACLFYADLKDKTIPGLTQEEFQIKFNDELKRHECGPTGNNRTQKGIAIAFNTRVHAQTVSAYVVENGHDILLF